MPVGLAPKLRARERHEAPGERVARLQRFRTSRPEQVRIGLWLRPVDATPPLPSRKTRCWFDQVKPPPEADVPGLPCAGHSVPEQHAAICVRPEADKEVKVAAVSPPPPPSDR